MPDRLWMLVVAVALMAPAPAQAHVNAKLPDVLAGAVEVADGLYEVPLRTGTALLTHGPDTLAEGEAGQASAGSNHRRPVCAAEFHQHVLYGRPLGAPDDLAAAAPIIDAAMSNMNAELDRAALESGGRHADYRVKCDSAGTLSIGTFINPGGSSFGDIVDAARLGGALDPRANYTIFYDDPTPDTCGVASLRQDEQPGADNASNTGGAYAVIYRDCWDGPTAMHESGHNLGAVQPGAPNASGGGGHCRDESDVMCYADNGVPTVSVCAGGERFDCGYDDYFDVAPEPGEYLATHWNVGSRANRFISFSDPVPGEMPLERACAGDGQSVEHLLAVDTIDCRAVAPEDPAEEEEEEEIEDPPVRITVASLTASRRYVQVRLACPAGRAGSCRGRVSLTRRPSRAVGGKAFRIAPGKRRSLKVPLVTSTRRATAAGRIRKLWVVARASDASADAARAVRMPRR